MVVPLLLPRTGRRYRADRRRRSSPSAALRLQAHVIELDGRPVAYATGGRGLPVLFLHGWGLDHRAYHRPLQQLMLKGCRVIAPSLPGFGGTASLASADLSLDGHANWVARFLTELGEREPFVVLGHSFGGGVATRLAAEHPMWASSLVLVNSVGDPTAFGFRLGPRTARPVGGRGLPAALALVWPSEEGAQVRRYSAYAVENLLRDPVAVTRTAWLAQRADVRADLERLAATELGVTVLWSDRDTVIPYSAFDTFCQTFGANGHVATGGHSWLLTEPDSFAQVLSNLLAVESERHRSASSGATTAELQTLLDATTIPARTRSKLLDGLSQHWLLSAPADVLAGDLSLCHPRLGDDEVRVVVRPVDDGAAHRLTVLAADRRGLLADTAAVLAAEGLSVIDASVQTWADRRLAMHSLTVMIDDSHSSSDAIDLTAGGVDDERWERVGSRLREPSAAASDSSSFVAKGKAEVIVTGEADGATIVSITAPDRPGLLGAICRWFADHDVSVDAASVTTVDWSAHDVFVVSGDFDADELRRALSATRRRH
ncbi:MAG: alpha/beta fold hydrolase [Acidimicrobiales bacterium]